MKIVMIIIMMIMNDDTGDDEQGRRENSEALGQKRRMGAPASEANRKLSGSRNKSWTITTSLLHEIP